mgnify:CR=1 FL=1
MDNDETCHHANKVIIGLLHAVSDKVLGTKLLMGHRFLVKCQYSLKDHNTFHSYPDEF